MTHDVFISYSSQDKTVADAMCATLEAKRIRCWIAPRDVVAGMNYAEALMEAISESRVMVLVFSSYSNRSQQVISELETAVNRGIPILPFRIENVSPTGPVEFHIRSRHWLDAWTPPLQRHLDQLAETVEALLSRQRAGRKAPYQEARKRPSAPRMLQNAFSTARRWGSQRALRLSAALGTAAAASVIIGAVVASLCRGGAGDSRPAVLGSPVPVVGSPTGSPTPPGPGRNAADTNPAQTSTTPNGDADLLRRIALSSADLGGKFDIRAEQTFAADAEGFCNELKKDSLIDCSGYDLEKNSFTVALVRDFGSGSEPGLNHLVNYVIAATSEADAYDIFKDLDTYNHLQCQWNHAEAYVVSDLGTSSVCDFTAPANVEFISGITSVGRFVVVVGFEGTPNPVHQRLVADALKKAAENMAEAE